MRDATSAASGLDVVAFVTSAGGLGALSSVLRGLPRELPAAVVVQQHLGGSGSALVEILRRRTSLPVDWAEPGVHLEPGRVLVAPSLTWLEVLPDQTVALHDAKGVARSRPHDALLMSLADSCGNRALGVVLTGMGKDGAAGVRALTAAGGFAIAQSEDTAEQPAMPRAAAEAGAALVLPLHEIAGVVLEMALGAPLPQSPAEVQAIREVFGDDGQIADLARHIDWSVHPLGSVRHWPPALRTALRMSSAYPTPFTVVWGADLLTFYNDAAIAGYGDDHPRIFARPAFESYPHRRDTEPMLRGVMAGQTVQREKALIPMRRNGRVTDSWFDIIYAPIPDPGGGYAGLTCAWNDRTGEVLAARRLNTLNLLTAVGAHAGPSQVLVDALTTLERSPDVAFALAYRVETPFHAQLVSACGVPESSAMAPRMVRLVPGTDWPLQQVIDSGRPVLMDDLANRFLGCLVGGDQVTPEVAVLHPLRDEASNKIAGVLVMGANPKLALDERYREFLTLVAGIVAARVADSSAWASEQQRLKNLAELDRAKIDFFVNTSSELRTPLTDMLSTLQDVLQFAPELPRCVTDDLAAAQRDGERLLRMVDSLLEFARLDDGRQRLHYQPTDLAALTAEVACMFADAARAAGLTLTVDAPTLAEPVWVDPQIWEKVVAHLVSNALKFTWQGGVDVRLRALSKHVELLVRDSGVGIPTGQLSEVLKRFHQVPDSIGRSRGGVGIGLALVDEWVRRHHGRIRVTSAEGVGTTVTVWMPTGRRRASFSGNDEPAPTGLVAAAMAAEARHWAEPREDADTHLPTVAQPVTAFGDDTSTA